MSELEKSKLKNEINPKDSKKVTNNFVFSRKAFTLSMETKKITEYEWPEEVISSEEAKWSFRHKDEFYAQTNETLSKDDDEYKDKIFVDNKWVKRRKDLYVIYTGRHPGLFNSWEEFTEYKGSKNPVEKEIGIYYLTSYIKNDLEVTTPYLVEISGIDSSQYKLKSKEDWKGELKKLTSLWSSKRLEFDNEETKKTFFQEYNDWASK